ncbi:hypothetical protein L208DRAFT_1255076 [Tricholoma matsutake]|nr:hypothetical protein L208DRAFT_1255076 [Tricholoma matsutake 945]
MSSSDAHSSLSTPSPARFHVSRTPAPPAQSILTTNINPIDDFFGYTFSSYRTHESRHEQSLADTQSLPPYIAEDTDLPPYARKAPETVTLAKYLFKFGFLFPPFWIIGALILLSPLRAPSAPTDPDTETAWLPEKTEAEREQIIAQMRKVEIKWAKRCLWATVILVLLGTSAGIAIWAALRS